jgi:hypothetical protein
MMTAGLFGRPVCASLRRASTVAGLGDASYSMPIGSFRGGLFRLATAPKMLLLPMWADRGVCHPKPLRCLVGGTPARGANFLNGLAYSPALSPTAYKRRGYKGATD